MNKISSVFCFFKQKIFTEKINSESDFLALIQLPEYIYTGMDAIGRIFDSNYKSILVITDNDTQKASSVLPALMQKAHKHSVGAELVACDNPDRLFSVIQEKLIDATPQLIVALGDGKISDCAMAVSSMTGIPYCTVPQVAPTALWESDNIEAHLSRRVPSMCILDPDMIVGTHSSKIAYEGLAMLTICAESFIFAEHRYIKAMAQTAFCQIYENLFDAFRGEISARENILEGMYWAHISFVNSHSFSWESSCYRLCDFFASFGVDGLSLLAVSCVQIIKNAYQKNEVALQQLARNLNLTPQTELSGLLLVEKIRQLRARMSVPSCIKNIGVDEDKFLFLFDDLGEEDKRLFFDCYYSDYLNCRLEEQVYRGS